MQGTDFSSSQSKLTLYNILRQISSLAGIEYFSASRNAYRTFYTESYAVDSLDRKVKIPDPVTESIPENSKVLIFQNDLTFGKNYYEVTYKYDNDSIIMTTVNRTRFTYYLVPLINPGNFVTHILAVPMNGQIMVYFLSTAKVPSMPGMQERVERSFSNRVEALYSWFSEKVKAAFQ